MPFHDQIRKQNDSQKGSKTKEQDGTLPDAHRSMFVPSDWVTSPLSLNYILSITSFPLFRGVGQINSMLCTQHRFARQVNI